MAQISFYFIILALVAEIVGTVGGFGSSVFFVPIGNFYFDFHSVLGLTAIFHLSSNLSKIFLFKKGLNKHLLIYIGIPSVIFVVIGGILSAYLDSTLFSLILGVFLIALSLLFLIKKNLKVKAEKKQTITGGALSGFFAGFLGTGGAIRGLTMAAFKLDKAVFIATSAFIDFVVDGVRTIVYYQNGYIHQHDLIYIPFLLAIGLIGTYIGKRILKHISEERFRKISLMLILLIGLITFGGFMYNFLS
jgi:uncharacterized membrane protein YfcA